MLNLCKHVRNGILKVILKNITKQKASKETMIKLERKLFLLWEYWQHLFQAYFCLYFGKYSVVFKMLLRPFEIIVLSKYLYSISASFS